VELSYESESDTLSYKSRIEAILDGKAGQVTNGVGLSVRVLITTQVFPPEIHPSAVMAKEMAGSMAREGWDVTVAAGYPHHPYGRLYSGYHKRWIDIEQNNGYRVVRGWHLINPSPAMIPRAMVMASQCAGFILGALQSIRPDLVISYGPPLIGPLTSSLIAGVTRAKLITFIYDIYPDILLEMGRVQNSLMILAARKLERLTYRASDHIVVLSQGFRRTLIQRKACDPENVTVIPVWLNGRDIIPGARDNPWRRKMGIGPEKFVVLYAGTIGLVSGTEVVIEAAKLLKDYPDILFLMVGEGHAKNRMETEARNIGLQNLRFLPFQPRECLSELQATADVSLVTLISGRGKTSVPSKVLGYMAAARPVISAVDEDCDTAELIQKAECGLVTPPGQEEALAEAVLYYYQHPEACKSGGMKGRQYFLKNFEKDVVLRQYVDLIRGLVNSSE
jgi:colanic acid biosynthesis glycosyl transferase WcaI